MTEENEDWVKWFRKGSILIVCLLVAFAIVVHVGIARASDRGVFGDQFGAINALFSGLGFLGLYLTLKMQGKTLRMQGEALELQSKDLNDQTNALNLQMEEFKGQRMELAKTAIAQERANALAVDRLRFDQLKEELEYRMKKHSMFVQMRENPLNGASFTNLNQNIELCEDRANIILNEMNAMAEKWEKQ